MNELRQAAETTLFRLLGDENHDIQLRAAIALLQALDLQTTIERGTKAWADVPDATEWVEELRGNDTPEVTPEVTGEVPCKTDPRAPHGFDRNASHSADRYVCECEGWEPVDKAYTKNDTTAGVLHKEWVGLTDEDFYKKDDETVFVLGMKFAEARLKEKNT